MKNILIPTILEADTVGAVKTAAKHASGQNCAVVLMLLCDVPDTYSAGYLLQKITPGYTAAQSAVLNKCKEIIKNTPNCVLQVHIQHGISAPLLKGLIEHKGIGLTILTTSYKQEQQKIHRYCTALLLNSKCPLLHLGQNCTGQLLSKAMYLEQEKTTVGLQEVQDMINDRFSFTIVSRAMLASEQDPEDLAPMLAEAIFKNDIDVLVETRKPEKVKLNRKSHSVVNEALGMPVLSLYEGVL
ncbi:hypothetical protein FMM05_04120 [Flavobacterium zepuense]|uniref:Universal stress protein family protein n=1 Tax=Flavobacterium zepuense TaxID=2593302 RepID=A0A552V7X2_9FLAO|nr:hypothetical protein [Flavobacterium zepuense]TRW26572.1 hypothetical protein FMM05_04120 [Flavobacterium zepuense]